MGFKEKVRFRCGYMIELSWDNILTKEFLIEEYINKKKSIAQISKEQHCGKKRISKRLNELNILKSFSAVMKETRQKSKDIYYISKQILYQEYKIYNHSIFFISKLFNVSPSLIYTLLKKFNISINKPGHFLKNTKRTIEIRKKISQTQRTGEYRFCVVCNKEIYRPKWTLQSAKDITCSCRCSAINRFLKNTHVHIKYNGTNFRSSWEANFAKWCDGSGIKWEYEKNKFLLKIANNYCYYIPDFYLPEFDVYIEIKGYWREVAKLKCKAFFEQYKNKNLIIFEEGNLKEIGIIK